MIDPDSPFPHSCIDAAARVAGAELAKGTDEDKGSSWRLLFRSHGFSPPLRM